MPVLPLFPPDCLAPSFVQHLPFIRKDLQLSFCDILTRLIDNVTSLQPFFFPIRSLHAFLR